MTRILLIAILPAFCAGAPNLAAQSKGTHPLLKDRTGIDWVLPFSAAKKKAATENRLLMIKPVAFGTSRDGGW